jgi:tetratricopeptide (TPR) repeat protein
VRARKEMRGSALALCVAAAIAALPVAGHGQDYRKNINDVSVQALENWIGAVRTHTPGRADDAVVMVAGWSFEAREDLNTSIGLFLSALIGGSLKTDNNSAANRVAALGRAAGKDFLKRAAVLHSDVAAYGDLFPPKVSPPSTSRSSMPQESHVGSDSIHRHVVPFSDPIPPLLLEDRIVLAKDGQVLGRGISTWNWPFARSLLDLLSAKPATKLFSSGRPDAATDPFVGAWYHATIAYMLARGLYADATPHLAHAALLLPEDPLILFDRGSYGEILGLPVQQALMADPDVNARAQASTGVPVWKTPVSEEVRIRVPPAAKTNAEAEALFRRALAIDPALAEARVRLARLLQLRGRHQESAAELAIVLDRTSSGAVGFYAHLFAGRAAEALGRSSDAAAHFAAASALFPSAQSALLAISHQALLQADVPGTIAPVARLGAQSADVNADPWWQYDRAAGRDADALLREMWAKVPRS